MENISKRKSFRYEVPRLTLRDMLRPLFRHPRVVISTFSLIFVVSIFFACTWANNYGVATMRVVVGGERLEPVVPPQPTAAVQETSRAATTDDVDTEVALLQGRDMLREVAQTCQLVGEGSSL